MSFEKLKNKIFTFEEYIRSETELYERQREAWFRARQERSNRFQLARSIRRYRRITWRDYAAAMFKFVNI